MQICHCSAINCSGSYKFQSKQLSSGTTEASALGYEQGGFRAFLGGLNGGSTWAEPRKRQAVEHCDAVAYQLYVCGYGSVRDQSLRPYTSASCFAILACRAASRRLMRVNQSSSSTSACSCCTCCCCGSRGPACEGAGGLVGVP